MSAAAQAHRIDDSIEIVVLEQGHDTSFSACGIPYWVGDLVGSRDDLVARTPEEHRRRGLTVHTGTRPRRSTSTPAGSPPPTAAPSTTTPCCWPPAAGPRGPPIEGLDAPGCSASTAWTTAPRSGRRSTSCRATGRGRPSSWAGGTSAWRWPRCCSCAACRSTSCWPTPLPMGLLDADMGEGVCAGMRAMGMGVHTDARVSAVLTGPTAGRAGCAHRRRHLRRRPRRPRPGHGPEARLAEAAGLAIGVTGGIDVDATMRSRSHDNVFAAGDCVQTYHHLTGEPSTSRSARTPTSRAGSPAR